MEFAVFVLLACFSMNSGIKVIGTEINNASNKLTTQDKVRQVGNFPPNDNHKIIINLHRKINNALMKKNLDKFTMVRRKSFFITPPFNMDVRDKVLNLNKENTSKLLQVSFDNEDIKENEENELRQKEDDITDHFNRFYKGKTNENKVVKKVDKRRADYTKTKVNVLNTYNNHNSSDNVRSASYDSEIDITHGPETYNTNINNKENNNVRNNFNKQNNLLLDALSKQNQLIEKIVLHFQESIMKKNYNKANEDFDDLLRSIDRKKLRQSNSNLKPTEDVKSKDNSELKDDPESKDNQLTADLESEDPTGLKEEVTTKTNLLTVMSLIDETAIKEALKNDQMVQRILRINQQRKEEYFKKAKEEHESKGKRY